MAGFLTQQQKDFMKRLKQNDKKTYDLATKKNGIGLSNKYREEKKMAEDLSHWNTIQSKTAKESAPTSVSSQNTSQKSASTDKVKAPKRDKYPLTVDPASYGKEREMNKISESDTYTQYLNSKKETYDKMVNKKYLTNDDLAKIQQNKVDFNQKKADTSAEKYTPEIRDMLITQMKQRRDRGEKLTYKEQLFADGKLVNLPDPTDNTPIVEPLLPKKQQEKVEAKKKKEQQAFYDKISVENQQLINKQNGTNKYMATTDKKQLTKALKGSLDLTNTDLDHLSKKDKKKLEKAKEDGVKKALLNYNGSIRNLDVDKALKYDNSWLYRRGFNYKDKVTKNDSLLKGVLDYTGDGAKYAGMRALDAIGAVQQGIQGNFKTFQKETGIEAGKLLKPLQGEGSSDERKLTSAKKQLQTLQAAKKQQDLLAKQQGKNAIDTTKMTAEIKKMQQKVDSLETLKKSGNWKKSDKGVETAKQELKDILTSKKSLNAFNPSTQIKGAKEGASDFWKSLSGYYTKHPEELNSAYKQLVEQGWDKNALSTKLWGFAGDVAAGISPTGAGKQIVVKGGKVVANESKLAKLLTPKKLADRKKADQFNLIDKALTKGVKNSQLGTQAKDKVLEALKTKGQVTAGDIDTIVNEMGSNALAASKAGKLSDVQTAKLKQKLLESRIARFKGQEIPEQSMSPRYQNAIKTNLANMSKREANGQNATKRQIEALGLNTIRGNQTRINNIVGAQNKQTKIDNKLYDSLLKRYEKVGNSIPALKDAEKASDTAFLDQFKFNNQTWADNLKDAALGPIKGDTKLTLFGKAIPGSDKLLNGVTKVPKTLGKAIGDTTLAQKFNANFNKSFRVDKDVQNKVYEAINGATADKAKMANDLQGLLKGASKKELQQLTYHMIRPDEVIPDQKVFGSMRGKQATLPERFKQQVDFNGETKSIYEHLKDQLDNSLVQDNASRTKNGMNAVKKLENYLPAVYKNSEKEVNDILGKTTNPTSTSVTPSSHEQKAFKDIVHAVTQDDRLKPIDDAGKLIYKRLADGIDFRSRQALKKYQDDMKKINPSMLNNQTQRYLNEAINPENYRRPERGMILSGIKKANDIWKGYTMNSVTGTALRNLYGGAVNNTLDGVGLKDYLRAAQMQFGKDTSKLNLADKASIEKAQFEKLASRNGINQGQYTTDMHPGDVFDGNTFGKKSIKDLLNPLNPSGNALTAPARKINSGVEQFLRNARFIKGLDEYGVEGAKQAGADVRKVHFDYNPQTALTNTEQNLRDYVVPFYTFQRFNLPFQAAKAVQNPGAMNAFANAPRSFNQNEPDGEAKPDYMNDYLYLGKNKDGTSNYLPTYWNSTNDFKDWFDPQKKVENAVAPWIKASHDSFADEGLGSGFSLKGATSSQLPENMSQDIVSKRPTLAKVLGLSDASGEVKQNRRNQTVINDLVPQANNIRNFAKAFSGGEGLKDPKVLNALLGVAPKPVDMEQQKFYNKQADQFKVSDQLKELMSLSKSDKRHITENKNFDPYAEQNAKNPRQEIPYYDMFRAYNDNIKQYEKIQEKVKKAQEKGGDGSYVTAAPYFNTGKKSFNDKMKYDLFGNPIEVQFKYASPKNEKQVQEREFLMQMVDEGRKKSEQDFENYKKQKELMESGKFNLSYLYSLEGYKDPYK